MVPDRTVSVDKDKCNSCGSDEYYDVDEGECKTCKDGYIAIEKICSECPPGTKQGYYTSLMKLFAAWDPVIIPYKVVKRLFITLYGIIKGSDTANFSFVFIIRVIIKHSFIRVL